MSLSWGRIFKWPDDFFIGSWSLRMDLKKYSANSQEDLNRYVGGLEKTDVVKIIQSIRRDSRDRPEFTTMGSLFSLQSTIGGWFLGGNEDFHKHVLSLEFYTPTFWKFVLASSLKLGVIKELPSIEKSQSIIPFDENISERSGF